VLQCVAGLGHYMDCVAVCYSVLQGVAVCWRFMSLYRLYGSELQ